jgi:uncharacterized protein YbjQ (UPF0145 family)
MSQVIAINGRRSLCTTTDQSYPRLGNLRPAGANAILGIRASISHTGREFLYIVDNGGQA